MVATTETILVIGGGSIGERHLGNLLAAGYQNLAVLRKRNLPFRNQELNGVKVVQTEAEAMSLQPKAAIICTPTSMHLEQSIWCLENGMHVLVEKPLSHNLLNWERLGQAVKQSGKLLYVGYMLRFHPLVSRIKEIVDSGQLGDLLSFTSHWGEYLPNWHPWEDYRTSYAAKADLGGGAALTLSHDLDLVNYLTGKPLLDYCLMRNEASELEVSADVGTDFLLKYKGGISGHVHLNYFEQPANRFLHLVFSQGRLEFYFFKNELHILTANDTQIEKADSFERNHLFVSELAHFFNLINSGNYGDVNLKMLEESETIITMCLNQPLKKA